MTAPEPGRRALLARWGRRLIPIAILSVIFMAAGTVGFVEYSARPSYCKSCHNMVPYYNSWAQSSHRNVPCIQCHFAPGIRAEAMGKFKAANQLVKYITGTYGMKPWAEISDAACLRSGCHSERKVEGVVMYRGVRFDHTKHLGELRRGKQLRCTSCHSQIVQGDHVAVTQTTCILCHFKDRPPGEPIASCTGCHPNPPRVVSPAGDIVDHAQFVRDRIACVSCHANVTRGNGAVDRARCFNCHNEPEKLGKFGDTTLVHRVHIADHSVECQQCHTPIEHREQQLATTFELDCKSCHTRSHEAQRRLYAGLGGHGTPAAPSRMFQARVSCLGCHGQPTNVRGHERVQLAGEASCISCHGLKYANMLASWQREMERRLAPVAPVVANARAAVNRMPESRRAKADSLVKLAEENVDLVRVGKSAHNVAYADRLLRASLDLVHEATRTAGLPYNAPALNLGAPVTANACFGCHIGAERARVTFQGKEFDHAPHLLRGGLGCIDCHTSLDQHGGTTISKADCNNCHHSTQRPMECTRCHVGTSTAAAPANNIVTHTGDFSHRTHSTVQRGCAACHTAPAMDARSLNCDNCHTQHHAPDKACTSCHRPSSGVLAKHTEATAHAACVTCHRNTPTITRWTRQVCTSCHVQQQTGHYTARPCEACHLIPALRAG